MRTQMVKSYKQSAGPQFGCRLPPELVRRLRLYSVNSGRRISHVVAEALESFLPKKITVREDDTR
jgi:predicted DNA-binding protein